MRETIFFKEKISDLTIYELYILLKYNNFLYESKCFDHDFLN